MNLYSVAKIFMTLLLSQETIYGQETNSNPNVQSTWNGTVRYIEKGNGTTGFYERIIDVVITQNKVSGTHKYAGKHIIENKVIDETVCERTGDGELG